MSVASNSKQENELKETPIETKFTWSTKTIEKLKELHVLQQGNWKSITAEMPRFIQIFLNFFFYVFLKICRLWCNFKSALSI